MRKFAAAAMIATLALLAGCGGDPHGELADEAIAVSREMPVILASIKDEASVKEAGEKLKALGTRMQDIKARGDALPKISKEKNDELKKRMETVIEELKPQVEANMERIMKENPLLLMTLLPALKELQATTPKTLFK